jgi:hypothetical protein
MISLPSAAIFQVLGAGSAGSRVSIARIRDGKHERRRRLASTARLWCNLQVKSRSRCRVRSHRDACEFCADALIRKAAAATRRRSIQEPESMLHRRCRHRQIPAQLCRNVIHTMIAGCPEGRGLGEIRIRRRVSHPVGCDTYARLPQ